MGLLRKLANKVATRVAGVGSPSSPPVDGRLPAHPPVAEPVHAPPNPAAPSSVAPGEPAAGRVDKPWYLDGTDADGWEEVNADVKKPG
jgi:hypothetical protein